jgi:hypothetical protein
MHTKNNPGCYHSMLRYLSEKTGIRMFKEIERQTVWVTSRHTGKKKLMYCSGNIVVVDKDGNRHAYMKDQKRYDLRGVEASYFLVSVMRTPEEFGVKINDAGNYRDSLGGGWYSNCNLYEVDGKYFATSECACAHNGDLVNPTSGQAGNNYMQLDPNTQAAGQQEEQATEQQNAQESASQDQAMGVDSEEGSTEG